MLKEGSCPSVQPAERVGIASLLSVSLPTRDETHPDLARSIGNVMSSGQTSFSLQKIAFDFGRGTMIFPRIENSPVCRE
jgi:hypothetical protein